MRDLALWVDDARDAFNKAVERGAKPVSQPRVLKDADGEIVIASFRTYGETIHSLVERKNYRGLFMPGFVSVKPHYQPPSVGLRYVDARLAGEVPAGLAEAYRRADEQVLSQIRLLLGLDQVRAAISGAAPHVARRARSCGLLFFALPARARIFLDHRHRVAALEPAVEIDVGAALRAERAKALQRRLAADRAAPSGAGRRLIHGRHVGAGAAN